MIGTFAFLDCNVLLMSLQAGTGTTTVHLLGLQILLLDLKHFQQSLMI